MNRIDAPIVSVRFGFRSVVLVLVAALTVVIAANPAIAQVNQETDQEGESGNADQSGEVSGSGDNSNQCVGIQPVTNTGNVQNVFNIEQYRSRIDDIEIEDVGNLTISPEQTVECDQEVNQAATASDTSSDGSCTWSWDNGWWCYWSTDGSWWAWDDGSWTAWDSGWWYAASGGWWWLGYDGWWWWDGAYWTYYGWDGWTTVSNVSAGALDTTGGLTTLGVLGTLGLAGTALVVRRARHD